MSNCWGLFFFSPLNFLHREHLLLFWSAKVLANPPLPGESSTPKRGIPGRVPLGGNKAGWDPLPWTAPAGSAGEKDTVPWALPHLSPQGSHPHHPVAPQSNKHCLSPPCNLIRLSLLPPSLLTFKNGPWQYPYLKVFMGIKWDKNCFIVTKYSWVLITPLINTQHRNTLMMHFR